MIITQRILFLIIIAFTINSCGYFKNKNKHNPEDVVARSYNVYLLKSDLPQFPSGLDSAKLASAYVDKWLREQVLLRFAKNNLSSDRDLKINNEVAKYKEELMVYEYESQLVDAKFKYNSEDDDLEKYYQKYLGNFILSVPISKLMFIKADKKVKLKDNVIRDWMKNSEENYKLNVVCNEYLMDCHLDTAVWVPRKYIVDRLKDINISESNLKGKATFAKISSGKYNLYLYVIDSKEEGDNAPFQYIKKEIDKLLYKKSKSNFIEETKKAMFEKAIKDHEVEIF